ncbi:D-lyxose/D-mannose family sugar isomerase [Deinococcus hohokamensis]|uniref:D-lyxose ketol-isomerase n=1 Tax=Deinococcus hohokamensis TaxID=309883 RepID=A0ABV9I7V8_9DEIO
MKRSEINTILQQAHSFMTARLPLPPFAHWSPEDWRQRGAEAQTILDAQLGWDITDFGLGDFERTGLTLLTIRNGTPDGAAGTPYAEKLLLVHPDQITPWHFHWRKTEDIINRGGGVLELRLAQATADETLADEPVQVRTDGVWRTLAPGAPLLLEPGESVTLPPYLYHTFTARGQSVLVGEVSSVNDDATDNRFLQQVGRFPTIEEDAAPWRYLVGDYAGQVRLRG